MSTSQPVVAVQVAPPSTDPSFAYAPGDIIAGKYALEEMLGEGGMGAVFRARNTAIDMPVAIKLIRADLNRELLSGRLLLEARAAAKLTHPAIVRVFDVGQTALGDPFIVMELLEGESLSTIIERDGPLLPVRAVQLLLPIADALSAAHAKGFVHRDVKPDNVFIVQDEGTLQPKLVDFGIVKLEQRDAQHKLTQAGAVLGSPDYMSPEQARGLERVDLRSDVWSFSVMLYEAVTGATPFESSNYNALLRLIVEGEPQTLKERGIADDTLSAIVAQGLSKDPNSRFGSLGVMGKALAVWLADQGVTQDVCGVSLESKWLTRQTDPNGAGRNSRSSFPDNWAESTSGVRNVGRTFANAPTLEASKPAGTPTSLAPVERMGRIAVQPRWLGLGGGLALVAAVALSIALSGRDHVQASTIHAAAQQTVVREVLPRTPTPESVESPIAPVTIASSPASATPAMPSASAKFGQQAKPGAAAHPAKPAARQGEATPGSHGPSTDLIAPY
jgi:serine/threonine protein kinase